MAITRTTDTDDDGTGTTGTIHDNAWLQAIYAAIESGWALDTYTPSWTGAGSNPSLVNGTISGKYINVGGKLVAFAVRIVAGSSTTFGSGAYSVSLPLSADTNFYGCINVFAVDASLSTIHNGVGIIQTSTTVSLFTQHDSAAASYTPTVPFTFAQSDAIVVHGFYFRS